MSCDTIHQSRVWVLPKTVIFSLILPLSWPLVQHPLTYLIYLYKSDLFSSQLTSSLPNSTPSLYHDLNFTSQKEKINKEIIVHYYNEFYYIHHLRWVLNYEFISLKLIPNGGFLDRHRQNQILTTKEFMLLFRSVP